MLVNILVPTLNGRETNAATFMRSLGVVPDADVTAVVELCDDEAAKAWAAEGANVRFADGRSFAVKINAGFRGTAAPWILMVGDDVRFHDGWLDALMAKAEETGADVIGTNDLGTGCTNWFSPHPFINRDYVNVEGASWDGPGIVCHEGYRHNYVDNEILRVAQSRGAWAMAWDAVIEHLHPCYGKGDDDRIYRLGQSFIEHDSELWRQRNRAHPDVPAK